MTFPPLPQVNLRLGIYNNIDLRHLSCMLMVQPSYFYLCLISVIKIDAYYIANPSKYSAFKITLPEIKH